VKTGKTYTSIPWLSLSHGESHKDGHSGFTRHQPQKQKIHEDKSIQIVDGLKGPFGRVFSANEDSQSFFQLNVSLSNTSSTTRKRRKYKKDSIQPVVV